MLKATSTAVTVILVAFFGITAVLAQPPGDGSGIVRLAERGDVRAQTRLGYMLATGSGIPQNDFEAAYWYRRAAEQGDPDAQYLLGVCFDLGKGVPVDFVLAHKWLNLSASRTRARDEREHRAKMRDAVRTKLSFPELDIAQSLATAWRPKRER
jgi:hypothetical protein